VVVDPTVGTTTVGSQIPQNNENSRQSTLLYEFGANKFLAKETFEGKCKAFVYMVAQNIMLYEYFTPIIFNDINEKPRFRRSKNEIEVDVSRHYFSSKNQILFYPTQWRSGEFYLKDRIKEGEYIWFGGYGKPFSPCFDYGGIFYKNWPELLYTREPGMYYDEDDDEWYEDEGEWSLSPDFPNDGNERKYNFLISWYFEYEPLLKNYVRTITQGVSLTDSRKLKADYKRSTTQTAKVNSACSRFETFYRNCAMTVSNTVNVGRFPEFFRLIADNIGLTVAKSESCSLTRVCSDNANASTENKTFLGICREIRDGLKGTDTQTVSVLIIRCMADNVAVAQHTRHWGAFIRGLQVTAENAAEAGHKAEYCRFNADTVQAEEKAIRGLLVFIRIIKKA
jgi:hypothetical protein